MASVNNGNNNGVVQQTIMEPPNNLKNFDGKRVIFCGSALLLLSFIWLCTVVTLYVVSAQSNTSVLYEARWLLVTTAIAGKFHSFVGLIFFSPYRKEIRGNFSAISLMLLGWFKLETFYNSALIAGLYSIASGIVVGLTYSWNLHIILQPSAENDLIISTMLKAKTKRQYVQLCLCLMITSLFIIVMSIYTVWTLFSTAKHHYKPVVLRSPTTKLLFTTGVSQICLALFSIYATAQLLGVKATYMHMYLIQEFHCSLLLLTLGLLQVVVSWRVNGLLLRSLLSLNVCQLVQELFYTWNAYYVALYLHTSGRKSHSSHNSQYDQVLMTTNFICHFSRLCCTAYVSVHLAPAISSVSAKLGFELSRGTVKLLSAASIMLFLLGAAHVVMDLSYTITENVYRTLIAFTGVSVFYAFMAAFSLILYSRKQQILYLMVTSVFLLLLIGASIHGLYVYIDTTYSQALVRHLENLEKSSKQPLLMHFTEGFLCLCGLVISVPPCFLLLRLLRFDSRHISHSQSGWILYGIFGQGLTLLFLTLVEVIIMLCVRDNWRLFDTNMAYSAMDVISMLITSALQIVVVNPFNKHFGHHLLVLTFVLLAEVITTFNYLNTYTTYIQLLILLYRLMGGYGSPTATSSFTFMFTAAHIAPLMISHVLQLLQWLLSVSSLISCCLLIEKLYSPAGTETLERVKLNGTGDSAAISVCQRVPLNNDCERELSDTNLTVKFCYDNAIICNSDELPTVSSATNA